mgnify:CR=1 FL=1
MRPIVTKGTNSVFGLDGYEKLPGEVYEEENTVCVQTLWQLTDAELEKLNKNKIIYISTVGEQPQPIAVSVDSFTDKG